MSFESETLMEEYARGYEDGVRDATSALQHERGYCHVTAAFDCSVCFYHFPTHSIGGHIMLMGRYPHFCPQCGRKVAR